MGLKKPSIQLFQEYICEVCKGPIICIIASYMVQVLSTPFL